MAAISPAAAGLTQSSVWGCRAALRDQQRAAGMARQASLLLRLLNLPAFLLAVFIMYWSVPLCMLQNRIRPWRLRGPRNDAYGWCVPSRCTLIAGSKACPLSSRLPERIHIWLQGSWAAALVRHTLAASAGTDAVQRGTLHLAGMLAPP